METEFIEQGFKEARAVTKKYAKSFYFASKFMDKNHRDAAYSVYSICRLCDQTVDNTGENSKSINLARIKKGIENAYAPSGVRITNPILCAFKHTVSEYNIPKEYFDELILGMKMDMDKTRYENFDELYKYCYRVAGVVGLIMLKIFGHTSPEAEKYAIKLGVAMQLTNIARDIKEDMALGRIYIPLKEMEIFNVNEEKLKSEIVDEHFISMMKLQIQRAKDFYRDAFKGIKYIKDNNSRLVVKIMGNIYAGILHSIEKNNYDVFVSRAHVTLAGKILIAIKTIFSNKE